MIYIEYLGLSYIHNGEKKGKGRYSNGGRRRGKDRGTIGKCIIHNFVIYCKQNYVASVLLKRTTSQ